MNFRSDRSTCLDRLTNINFRCHKLYDIDLESYASWRRSLSFAQVNRIGLPSVDQPPETGLRTFIAQPEDFRKSQFC